MVTTGIGESLEVLSVPHCHTDCSAAEAKASYVNDFIVLRSIVSFCGLEWCRPSC